MNDNLAQRRWAYAVSLIAQLEMDLTEALSMKSERELRRRVRNVKEMADRYRQRLTILVDEGAQRS